MEEDAHRQLPATVLDLEHGEAMSRYPARAARILDEELDRLSRKQAENGLTEKEVEMIPRLVSSSAKVEKALRERGKQQTTRRGTGKAAGESGRAESALERLAREMRDGDGGEVQSCTARTRPRAPEPAATTPDTAAAAEQAVSAPPPTTDAREEAAKKARAALRGALPAAQRVRADAEDFGGSDRRDAAGGPKAVRPGSRS